MRAYYGFLKNVTIAAATTLIPLLCYLAALKKATQSRYLLQGITNSQSNRQSHD